jgi:hypothetical protein
VLVPLVPKRSKCKHSWLTSDGKCRNKNGESNSANFMIKSKMPKTLWRKLKPQSGNTKTSGDAATKSTKNKSKIINRALPEKGENENDVEDVHIDGETVTVGDMKISEKGVEMPDAIITDKGVSAKTARQKFYLLKK